VFLSSSVVLTSVTLLRGKFKAKGYRTLTTTTALLVVISLLSTLYLSWQSQSLVRVVKTPPTPMVHNASFWKEKQDQANATFSASLQAKKESRQQIIADYQTRIKAAGTQHTSWLIHLKTKDLSLLDAQIASINQQHIDAINTLHQQETNEQQTIAAQNQQTLSHHDHQVAYYGGVVKYSNVLINMLRAFLLIIFVKWVLAVKNEQHQSAKNASPGYIPVGNTLSPREAPNTTVSAVIHTDESVSDTEENTESNTETQVQITDISGLKNAARVYYTRSISSASSKARAANQKRYENKKAELENLGYSIAEKIDRIEIS
jgi:hypothetical protein